MNNYELNVISHHRDFNNKTLKKYNVDSIDTVGAYGSEPFSILFKNHTYEKIQVKLSIDGTDILTGDLATTEVSKDMWVVEPYGTLNLKAWPETHQGGARFVFTNASNSVAVHLHGDLSSRGIIAAAVFTEGQKPIYVPYCSPYSSPYSYNPRDLYWNDYPISCNDLTIDCNNESYGSYSSNVIGNNTTTMDCYLSDISETNDLVAVGTGEYTDQHISYTAGLIKPQFAETIRLRYLWWDELVAKLKKANYPMPHGSGFPGDKNKGINLGNTPRIASSTPHNTFVQPSYSRF